MNQPIRADLAYPSLDHLSPDPVSARIIAPAYAGQCSELSAICQYTYQHLRFAHNEMEEYALTLENIAITEMMHLELLGTMLINLGVDPVLTACPPFKCNFFSTRDVSTATSPTKMIMDDIESETKAIAEYRTMLCKLRNERVAAVIQRIIMDEEVHLTALNDLLCRLG